MTAHRFRLAICYLACSAAMPALAADDMIVPYPFIAGQETKAKPQPAIVTPAPVDTVTSSPTAPESESKKQDQGNAAPAPVTPASAVAAPSPSIAAPVAPATLPEAPSPTAPPTAPSAPAQADAPLIITPGMLKAAPAEPAPAPKALPSEAATRPATLPEPSVPPAPTAAASEPAAIAVPTLPVSTGAEAPSTPPAMPAGDAATVPTAPVVTEPAPAPAPVAAPQPAPARKSLFSLSGIKSLLGMEEKKPVEPAPVLTTPTLPPVTPEAASAPVPPATPESTATTSPIAAPTPAAPDASATPGAIIAPPAAPENAPMAAPAAPAAVITPTTPSLAEQPAPAAATMTAPIEPKASPAPAVTMEALPTTPQPTVQPAASTEAPAAPQPPVAPVPPALPAAVEATPPAVTTQEAKPEPAAKPKALQQAKKPKSKKPIAVSSPNYAEPEEVTPEGALSDRTRNILRSVGTAREAAAPEGTSSIDIRRDEYTTGLEGGGDGTSQIKMEVKSPGPDIMGSLTLAYSALTAGQYEAAISLYKKALKEEPRNADALFGLATAYQKSGQSAQARTVYGRLLNLYPEHVEGLNNFIVLASQESPQETLALLTDLERKRPDFSPIPAQIGMIQYRSGNLPEAARNLNRAVALDPSNLSYRYNLAITLDEMGDKASAMTLYRQLIEEGMKGKPLPGSMRSIQERLTYLGSK